jgi:hypothetical protein
MTTKTMTATAPEKPIAPAVKGPKIKTALPGPNAKRVLAGDQKYHFAFLHPLLPAGGQERPRHRRH